MNSRKYFFSALSGYVISGFVPLLFRQLTSYDKFEIAFYRTLLTMLLMLVAVVFHWNSTLKELKSVYKQGAKVFSWMLFLNALGGILLVSNWVSYIYVVNFISLNAAAFAYLIFPIVTTFLAFIILKEKLNRLKVVAILISVVSCALMSQVKMDQTLYIFAVTLSYSFYVISQKRNTYLSRKLSFTLQMFFGMMTMLMIDPLKNPASHLPMSYWMIMLVITSCFTVLPILLNLYAMNGLSSSAFAFLMYVNPIIAFLCGIFLYGEVMSLISLLAYFLLALATIIFNWDIIRLRRSRHQSA